MVRRGNVTIAWGGGKNLEKCILGKGGKSCKGVAGRGVECGTVRVEAVRQEGPRDEKRKI